MAAMSARRTAFYRLRSPDGGSPRRWITVTVVGTVPHSVVSAERTRSVKTPEALHRMESFDLTEA